MAVALVSLDKNRGELHSGQPGVLETQTACGRIAVLASGATVEEDWNWDSWNEARSTCLLTVGKVTTVRHVQCSTRRGLIEERTG
jgi:hypothetical protein